MPDADANYIIDLILRARDDTAAAFASANTNADVFQRKLEEHEQQSRKNADAFEDSARRISATQRQAKQDLDDLAGGNRKVLAAQREVEASAQRVAQVQSDAHATDRDRLATQLQLIDATTRLNKVRAEEAQNAKAKALEEGNYAQAMEKVNRLRTEANRLESESVKNNDRIAHLRAEQLKQQANQLESSLKLNQSERTTIQNESEKLRQGAERNAQLLRQRETMKQLEESARRYSAAFDSREAVRHREELERHGKTLRDLGHDAADVQKILDQAFDSRKVEQQRRAMENLTAEQKNLIKETERYQKQVNAIAKLEQQRRDAESRGLSVSHSSGYDALVKDIERAKREAAELAVAIRAAAGTDINIGVDLDTGAFTGQIIELEALKAAAGTDIHLDVDVDMAAAIAKLQLFNSLKENAGREPHSGGGLFAWLRSLGKQFDSSSSKIATFDNYLMGLASLGVVVFLSQIIVAAGALGGALLALGSSAVSAAGALGGSLVAGLSQVAVAAGPAIAAIVSLQGIFKAVQQDQLMQQQQFGKTADTAKRVATATDAVTNASENLVGANKRVIDAQQGIIDARARAITQLRDLILQEKEAELAAKGANLSLEESRDRLAQAQSSGDTGAIARARLDVQGAQLGTRRASNTLSDTRSELSSRRSSGIEGSPEVSAAKDQLDSAEKSARAAARSLKQAQQSATEAGDASLASAEKLQYMLSQMSEAERALYVQISTFVEKFREVGPKIAEPLIESFTRAMIKINGLLDNNEAVQILTELSDKMSAAFDKVFDRFTSGEYGEAFKFFADEAGKNMDVLSDIIVNIGDIFIRLGRAAAPALAEILKYVESLSKRWADFLSTEEGQKKTTDFLMEGVHQFKLWIGLLGSIGRLFGTIMSGGGLREGTDLIEGLTNKIDKFNKSLQTKEGRKDLAQFFETTKNALAALGIILGAIADGFNQLFTPEGVQNLEAAAAIISDILIPALVDVLNILGDMSRAVGDFFEANPMAEQFAKAAITGALLAGIGSKILAVFGPLVALFGGLARAANFLTGGLLFRGVKAAVDAVHFRLLLMGEALKRAGLAALTFARTQMTALLGALRAAGTAVLTFARGMAVTLVRALVVAGRAMLVFVASNPLLLAITAIIGALVYLQVKFKIFNKLFDFIKEFTGNALDWLKKNWKSILPILAGPFGLAFVLIKKHWGSIKSAFGDAIDFFKDLFRSIGRTVGRGVSNIVDFFKDLPNKIGDAMKGLGGIFEKVFKGAVNLAISALNAGIKIINKILGPKDLGPLGKTPDLRIPEVKKLQSGAYVKGNYAEGDKYPALLAGDEAVLNPRQMAMIGRDKIMRVLRATGAQVIGQGAGYATGGMPSGSSSNSKSASADSEALTIDLGMALVIIGQFGKRAVAAWDSVWDRITKRTRQGKNSVTAIFENLYSNVDESQDKIGKRLTKGWDNIREQVGNDSRGLRRDIQNTMQSVKSSVYDGMKYVASATNTVLKGFDAEPVNLSIEAPTKQRAATGYLGMQGERGGDAIPIMVGRGEAVLNWAHQKMIEPALRAYYGTGLADLFDRTHAYHAGGPQNMGMPGFAKGGFTGPFGSGEGFNAVANFAKRKFGLSMTSGKDNHSLYTSSGNISDHSKGMAGDFSNGSSPTPEMDAFSNFWKTKLPQTVKQLIWRNKDQFQGFPVGGHMDHVHLAMKQPYAFDASLIAKLVSRKMRGLSIEDLLAGVTGGTADVEHIDAPKVKGKKGSLRTIVQKALARVTKAANRHLDTAFGQSADGFGSGEPVHGEHYDGELNRVFPQHGLGGVRGAIRFTADQVMKIAQSVGLPGRPFEQIAHGESNYYPGIIGDDAAAGYGNTFGYGLWQITKGVGHEKMVERLGGWQQMLNPYKNALAAKSIYEAAGRRFSPWYGTKYLTSRARGGYVGAPMPGFARGGFVGAMRRAASGYIDPRVSTIRRTNSYKAPAEGIETDNLGAQVLEYGLARDAIKRAIANTKRLVSGTKKIAANFTALTKDGGLLDQINTGIQSTIETLDRNLKTALYGVNKSGEAYRRLTPEKEFEITNKNMLEGLRLMKRSQERIGNLWAKNFDAINNVEDRINEIESIDPKDRTSKQKKDLKALQGDLSDLKTNRTNLKQRLKDSQAEIAAQIEAIYQAQLAEFSRVTDEAVANAKSSAGNNAATIANLQRKATALGKGAELDELAGQSIQAMQSQQNVLRSAIEEAKSRGYSELAEQYRTQLDDLEASIVEATSSRLQSAIDAVNNQAARSLAGIDRRMGSADLLDRVGGDQSLIAKLNATLGTNFSVGSGGAIRGAALSDQASALANQKSELQKLLASAAAQGNLGAVDQLTDALADLDKTIGENIVAQAENTSAIRQSAIDAIASRTQFQTGVFGGLSGLVSAVGSASGSPADQDRIRGLLGQSGAATRRSLNENADLLAGFGVDVRGKTGLELVDALKNVDFEKIASGLSPADKAQFENLTNAVISNATELENNTQQLNELNGGNQLQGFTSSAWSFLRTAIFDGMGNTLPQYTLPSFDSGGGAVSSAIAQMQPGPSQARSIDALANAATLQEGDINITVHEAGQPTDANYLARQAAFARRSSRGTR